MYEYIYIKYISVYVICVSRRGARCLSDLNSCGRRKEGRIEGTLSASHTCHSPGERRGEER